MVDSFEFCSICSSISTAGGTFSISIKGVVVAQASRCSQVIHLTSMESKGVLNFPFWDNEQQAPCEHFPPYGHSYPLWTQPREPVAQISPRSSNRNQLCLKVAIPPK